MLLLNVLRDPFKAKMRAPNVVRDFVTIGFRQAANGVRRKLTVYRDNMQHLC
jgi:hypothetical protein